MLCYSGYWSTVNLSTIYTNTQYFNQLSRDIPPFRMLCINIAGKTSILCHLANVVAANMGVVKSVGTAPTVATQMVEFRRRNVRWVAWDMSGQGAVLVCWLIEIVTNPDR